MTTDILTLMLGEHRETHFLDEQEALDKNFTLFEHHLNSKTLKSDRKLICLPVTPVKNAIHLSLDGVTTNLFCQTFSISNRKFIFIMKHLVEILRLHCKNRLKTCGRNFRATWE